MRLSFLDWLGMRSIGAYLIQVDTLALSTVEGWKADSAFVGQSYEIGNL